MSAPISTSSSSVTPLAPHPLYEQENKIKKTLPKGESNVFSLIRSSCSQLISAPYQHHITISHDAITKYVSTLDRTKMIVPPKTGYPLKFQSIKSEINLIATLALLQFGSGYRLPLHAKTGRGAADLMLYGVMGLHIQGEINARIMSNMTITDVSDIFRIPISEEYELQPGIHSERPTELTPLAQSIRRALNETGNTLMSLQYDTIADFILDEKKVQVVSETKSAPSAATLVSRLVQAFPTLNDRYSLSIPSSSFSSSSSSDGTLVDTEIYIFKKAQLIVSDLYRRFHNEEERLNFSDMNEMTVFADNVLPCVLHHLGILEYDDVIKSYITIPENGKQKIVTDAAHDAEIRASAIVACQHIVSQYNATHPNEPPLTEDLLDYHLWQLGKVDEYRKLTRHATRDTYFY